MSLYGGLGVGDKEVETKDRDVVGWGSRMKLLETQKQLQAKKASLINLKKRQSTTVAPVIDLKRRNEEGSQLYFNQITGKLEKAQAPVQKAIMAPAAFLAITEPPAPVTPVRPVMPFLVGSEPPVSFLGVTDEYDPVRPNDYEDFIQKRREARQKEREDERKREIEERERRRKERHRERGDYSDEEDERDDDPERDREMNSERDRDRDRERDQGGRGGAGPGPGPGAGAGAGANRNGDDSEFDRRRRMRDEEEEEDYDRPRRSGGHGGAAIAPPQMLIEDNKTETGESEPIFPKATGADSLPGASFGLAGSVASKIMARMGYREGQGLGKSEQGMSMALQVEKTSKRGGKIIHEKDLPKGAEAQAAEAPRAEVSNANLLKNPSKVILLRNMVAPGDVDEDLEPETAEECTKYGKVNKCLIFEIPTAVETEAVRIFIEFERQEAAIKAVVDLNGRYFGGRVVSASFYNLDRFRRLDLGDEVVE